MASKFGAHSITNSFYNNLFKLNHKFYVIIITDLTLIINKISLI